MIPRAAREAVIVLNLIAMIFAVAMPGHAQQSGQLAGAICDQTGGALVGASVTVRGAASREGKSDAAGRFEFRDLPSSDYDLGTALEGFESAHRAIRLPPGETLSVFGTSRYLEF
jgi:hypothetical protein